MTKLETKDDMPHISNEATTFSPMLNVKLKPMPNLYAIDTNCNTTVIKVYIIKRFQELYRILGHTNILITSTGTK